MSMEKFSLKWNDFEKNISGALKELKEEDELYDVTLACDGGGEFPAHRLVLAACSQVLRQVICRKSLLRGNQHQQVIYLRGVNSPDLQSVLNFMYLGEVNIAQDHLNSFLAIAEELQVKGLTQSEEGEGGSSQPNIIRRPRSSETSKQTQSQSRLIPPEDEVDDDDIQEVLPVKTEAAAVEEEGGDLVSYEDENTDLLDYNDQQYVAMESGKGELRLCDNCYCYIASLDFGPHKFSLKFIGFFLPSDEIKSPEDLYQYVVKFGSGFQCVICQKTFTRRNDGWNHCENLHFPGTFEYACEHCDERFRSNLHYKKHKSNKHRVY